MNSSTRSRLNSYVQLIRLDRPIGIFLLLWPTLWALWLASNGMPDITVLCVFVVGVILMRSAGCAINDLADRNFDGHVARTSDRPLPNRQIYPREALALFLGLSLIAFLLVVIFLDRLTLLFSVPALLLAASYPFAKRIHYLPQVHLGAAFAWAVPMAFVAINHTMPPPVAWLLYVITIAWTTAYDTLYGMADREDDLKIGVKSTAILFGEADRLIIGILQLFVLLGLVFVGAQKELGLYYYLGVITGSGFFIYQLKLIKQREPSRCIQAFLNNHYFGMIIFLGIALNYWLSTN